MLSFYYYHYCYHYLFSGKIFLIFQNKIIHINIILNILNIYLNLFLNIFSIFFYFNISNYNIFYQVFYFLLKQFEYHCRMNYI